MAYAIGRLPASALTTVQTGIQLATPTAARYRLLKAAAKRELGRVISIAQRAGGYRSDDVQDAMHVAGSADGTLAQRIYWGLSRYSVVAIAAHPGGTHETGTRVDIVGTPMDAKFIALARRFGFELEFGPRDPNHFIDRGTYKVGVIAKAAVKGAPKKVTVTVTAKAPNNSLSAIAAAHSTRTKVLTVTRLLELNPKITRPDLIRVGQKIRVA